MRRLPRGWAITAAGAAALAAVGLSLFVGSVPWSQVSREILWEYRLGRALLAFGAGASLAVSGLIFQGLFRNPLADPFVVGVSGGASLGAVGMVTAGVQASVGGLGATTAAALAGGLGAALLSYRIARVRGRVPVEGLVLAGSALGSFCGALVSVLLLWDNRNWNEVIGWLMGNLGRPDPAARLAVVGPCLAVGAAAAAAWARDLNCLLLGEESAQQLGVEVERAKGILLVAGAVPAAGAVATCGIIGFVGLIVPHAARRWVGPDHRGLWPVAALAGGALLAGADAAARALAPGEPLPIGAVTALLGAPFFISLLRRRARRT